MGKKSVSRFLGARDQSVNCSKEYPAARLLRGSISRARKFCGLVITSASNSEIARPPNNLNLEFLSGFDFQVWPRPSAAQSRMQPASTCGSPARFCSEKTTASHKIFHSQRCLSDRSSSQPARGSQLATLNKTIRLLSDENIPLNMNAIEASAEVSPEKSISRNSR